MTQNVTVCGKSAVDTLTTGDPKVENIKSTLQALHAIDPSSLTNIGNAKWGTSTKVRGFVFGRNNIINDIRETLWNGPTSLYVYPPSPMQMRLVSTSVNDAAAGTGIRTVSVQYLDTNYVQQEEIVTLNGTTPVNTVATNILRINFMHAMTTGSNRVGVGVVSLTDTVGTVTYSLINAGDNSARIGVYTVPAGVTGYITHWQASSGSTGNHFTPITLAATSHQGVRTPDVLLVQDEQGTQNGGIAVTFPTPIPIPEKTDVMLAGISDNNAANVIALGAVMGYFEVN